MFEMLKRHLREMYDTLLSLDPINYLMWAIGLFVGFVAAVLFLPFDFSEFARNYGTLIGGTVTGLGIMATGFIATRQMKHAEKVEEARAHHNEEMEQARIRRKAMGATTNYLYQIERATFFFLYNASRLLGVPDASIPEQGVLGRLASTPMNPGAQMGIDVRIDDHGFVAGFSVTDAALFSEVLTHYRDEAREMEKIVAGEIVGISDFSHSLHNNLANVFLTLQRFNESAHQVGQLIETDPEDEKIQRYAKMIYGELLLYAQYMKKVSDELTTIDPETEFIEKRYLTRIEQVFSARAFWANTHSKKPND
eukprot:s1_g2566.t1